MVRAWPGERNNLLYITSKRPTTITMTSLVSALFRNETSQPVKHKKSCIVFRYHKIMEIEGIGKMTSRPLVWVLEVLLVVSVSISDHKAKKRLPEEIQKLLRFWFANQKRHGWNDLEISLLWAGSGQGYVARDLSIDVCFFIKAWEPLTININSSA
jgi:hypothetical protein